MAIVGYVLSITILKDYFPTVFWFLLVFFILTTYAFHYGLMKSCNGDPKLFFRYYMGATTFKLFGYLTVIIAYALINRNGATPFIITFLVLYFFYMVFEVSIAYRILRKK